MIEMEWVELKDVLEMSVQLLADHPSRPCFY